MKKAWVFSCIVALSVLVGGCGKQGSGSATEASGASAADAASAASGASAPAAAASAPAGMLGSIAKAQLPAEAAETLRLIKAGGPFPFTEDGVMFRNSAGLLAQHPRGYYRTYTVRTPGATDRGLRRIVCGGARKQTNDCYYTEDYYVSFRRIAD